MPAPTSVTVQIEFVAGTWTDVTQWVDFSQNFTIKIGRSTPFSPADPGDLSNLTLDNTDGRFTPFRQRLADNTTLNPYYPNVLPRKRIQVLTNGNVDFTGYIKGWPPSMVDGYKPRVVIQASTRDDKLSHVYMQAPIAQQILSMNPLYYWPLTDPAGSAVASEVTGSQAALNVMDGTPPLTFGVTGVGEEANGTAVSFSSNGTDVPGFLLGAGFRNINAPYSMVVWVKMPTPPASPRPPAQDFAGLSGRYLDSAIEGDNYGFSGNVALIDGDSEAPATGHIISDGAWHLITLTVDAAANAAVYVGSTKAVDWPNTFASPFDVTTVWHLYLGTSNLVSYLGASQTVLTSLNGSLAHCAIFSGVLTTDQMANLVAAAKNNGFIGETTSDRIKRFLGYAGLTSADWNIDSSTVLCSGYPQEQQRDIISACQDMAVTEGGGSVFYFGPDGKARFTNRYFRNPTNPQITVDAVADLDGSQFSPAFDDSTIVNQEQANRDNAGGIASTQIVEDLPSEAAYGLVYETLDSYAETDSDVLYNAQDRLAQQRQPGFRLGTVTVDMWTSQNDLYAAVASAEVGDRMRITNIYSAAAPASQLDVLIEGWTKTIGVGVYSIAFDTSPADNPPRMVWSDTTYGRWQCDGNTVSTGYGTAATSIVIATAAGKPTFTTDPTMYPLTICVNSEQITLNSPPPTSTSPQTFTGVTRGANGTAKGSAAVGDAVQLAPASTWSI